MNVKMEEQSAMNNDQLQVDRRLLNICSPKIGVWSASTWKGDISLLESFWYRFITGSLSEIFMFK